MIERKRIYIAGAVTGLDYDDVLAKFEKAEKEMLAKGYFPTSPVRVCKLNWDWLKCMKNCIRELLLCDSIYMLKDWRLSRGAKLEHFIALKLNYEIILEK